MKALEWLHTRAAQRANYGVLLGALLLVIAGYPMLRDLGIRAPALLSAFFALVLLSCLAAAVERTWVLALAIGLVLVLELVAGLFSLGGPGAHSAPQHAARGCVLLLTAGILLGDVLRARAVDLDTILGAVCVYLLLGLVGAEFYALLLSVDPEALSVPTVLYAETVGQGETLALTGYFSFTTMTTLGYGDVVPVTATARAFAMLQAVTGQLYIAVIVARLVALHVSVAGRRTSPHQGAGE